jgi:hypothetical protein
VPGGGGGGVEGERVGSVELAGLAQVGARLLAASEMHGEDQGPLAAQGGHGLGGGGGGEFTIEQLQGLDPGLAGEGLAAEGAQGGDEGRHRGRGFLVVGLRLAAVAEVFLEEAAGFVGEAGAGEGVACLGGLVAVALDQRVDDLGGAVGVPGMAACVGAGGGRLGRAGGGPGVPVGRVAFGHEHPSSGDASPQRNSRSIRGKGRTKGWEGARKATRP